MCKKLRVVEITAGNIGFMNEGIQSSGLVIFILAG